MEKFPQGLLSWSGNKQGSVRTPFRQETGRPIREQLLTPLVLRLNQWVDEVIKLDGSLNQPRTILLVGGPGNGKTDAVEGCIKKLDEALDAGGKIYDSFAKQYNVSADELEPRKTELDLSQFWPSPSAGFSPHLSLVQDATEGDQYLQGKSPEELLLEELEAILSKKYNGLYLCCVNRGILANALSLAHSRDNEDLIKFIDCLVEAATSKHDSLFCWPLEGYEDTALWPMDVESLVDFSTSENGKTVACKILDVALAPNNWVDNCEAGAQCPFCQNRKLLEGQETRRSLVKLLHYYELESGKRWTFRDIYSLIAFLLLGEQDELEIDKKILEPCTWAAKQLAMVGKASSNPNAKLNLVKAQYLLVSKLYYHRLFSLWPKLNSASHRAAKNKALPTSPPANFPSELKKGYEAARNHYRYLASLSPQKQSSIARLLTDDFSKHLDPALVSDDTVLFNKDNESITVSNIEERFGLSVKDGIELVKDQITLLEQELLTRLSTADDMLLDYNHKRVNKNHVRLLQLSIRQFSSRLVKRSICVRKGVCKDHRFLEKYISLTSDEKSIKNIQKLLRDLLNEDSYFKSPLSTTFGQPVAHRDRSISLITNKISIKLIRAEINHKKPTQPLPFVKIHNNFVPVTFKLFKSLEEISEGLQPSSLPGDIFALIDGVKSLISGDIVRDDDFLDDGLAIEIGQERFGIDINNGKPMISGEL
jgi:hypothetical protein